MRRMTTSADVCSTSLEIHAYLIYLIGSRFWSGSTVVYPYNNTAYEPVELGASIFVEINKNMWRATEEFGLERIGFGDDDNVMGIWDGKEFVLTVCTTSCVDVGHPNDIVR